MSDTIASAVADLRDISLDDLAAERGAVDDALLRVLPGESAHRVPAAMFNSSI